MAIATQIKNSANSHLGIVKYSSGHKKIVDGYNSVLPRPVGYAVKYSDDWCDTFVTYIGDINGAAHLIGRECGVQRHVAIFKNLGIWLGKVRPRVGDIIVFDWQANGWADHIGFVVAVNGDWITTTEGNTNNRVGQNTFKYNDWRITGYARPKYGQQPKDVTPKKVNDEVIKLVLAGAYGNGNERVRRLAYDGYDPEEVQKAVNKAVANQPKSQPVQIGSDIYLSYNGNTLSTSMVNSIVKYAIEYDINPVFLITMLHFEGLWGSSEVSRQNNNLGGMTWPRTAQSPHTRPSGVIVTKGSARPANEGGHYIRYNSVDDFLKDWFYLLRPNHFYKVTDNKSFEDSVKGLFKVGGAQYDYAASGYNHYLTGMTARRNHIDKTNPGKFNEITKAFNGNRKVKDVEVKEPKPVSTGKPVNEVAKEVIAGQWGVGEDRVTRLNEAGYNYEEVQAKVNELLAPQQTKSLDEVAKEVISGQFGNGKDRTEKLRQQGYNAEKVQARVNELLKGDLTEVAKDVIRGQYGNGQARIRNLRAVGYNPDDVQAKVNEILG